MSLGNSKKNRIIKVENFFCLFLILSLIFPSSFIHFALAQETNPVPAEVTAESTISPAEVTPTETLSPETPPTDEVTTSPDENIPTETLPSPETSPTSEATPTENISPETLPSPETPSVDTVVPETLPPEETPPTDNPPSDTPTPPTTEVTDPLPPAEDITTPLQDLVSEGKDLLKEQINLLTTTTISTETSELTLPEKLFSPMIVRYKNRTNETPLEVSVLNTNVESGLTKEETNYIYKDALPSTDLKYEITENGVKESIILKDNNHPNQFQYQINLDQFDSVQLSPNSVALYKKGEKDNPLSKLYTLSAPKMTDANGNESTGITLALENNILTLTPDADWLSQASYPVIIDPTIEITVLNVHSHPVAGEYWNVDFTTVGTADLTITPADQATIDDMQFTKLSCGTEERTDQAQVDPITHVIFYPNWNCGDVATVSLLDLKTGNHHLIFNFNSATEEVTAEAFNANRVWTGASGDGKWSTMANWSPSTGSLGSADNLTFDNTLCVGANCDSHIDTSVSITSVTMASTYPGILTQDPSKTLTASETFSVAGGTFVGGDSAMDVKGSFNMTGGNFTPTGGAFTIALNFSLSGGTFSGTGKSLTFYNAGSGATTFTCTGDFNTTTGVGSVSIAKNAAGTFTLASGCTLTAGVNINANSSSLTINSSASLTATGSSFLSGTLTNNGSITFNGTTFDSTQGFNTTFTNSGTISIPNVTSFVTSNFTNNSTLDLPSATVFDINSNFINNSGAIISYPGTNINVSGNWTQSGTFDITGKTLIFDNSTTGGSNATTFTCTGDFNTTTGVGSVSIAKNAAGTFTLASGCTLTAGVNINANSSSLTINSSASLTATGSSFLSGTLTNNGSITFNGTTFDSTQGFNTTFTNSGTISIPNVTSFVTSNFTNNSTLDLPSATVFDINSNFINNSGAIISYPGTNINVSGNWTQSGTFDITGKTLIFDNSTTGGSNATTFTCTGDFNTTTGVGSVSIAKNAAGTFTLASGCTLTAGVNINANSSSLTINSSASLTATGSSFLSGTLTNNGSITFNGTTFDSTQGFNTTFTNSGTISIPNVTSFVTSNFTNNSTLDLPSATVFDINSNFINNSGAIISYPGTNINVSGNWTQSGTFDITGKTLIFDNSTTGGSNATTFTCTGDFNTTTGVGSVSIAKNAAGTFTLASGCTLTAGVNINANSSSLTINSSASLTATGSSFLSGTLTNNGSITFNGTTFDSTQGFNTTFTNSGTISIPNVTSFVTSNFTNNSTLDLPSATVFDINSNFINNSGAIISYPGTNINVSGNWTQSGTFDITGKTLIFDNSTTGGSNATTFTCTGDFNTTTGVGSVSIAKNAAGTFTLASGCTLTAGVGFLSGNNTSLTINSSASLTATGSSFLSGTLTNNGSITFNGTTFTISGNFTNNVDATIIYSGSGLTVQGSWIQNGTFNIVGKTLLLNSYVIGDSTFNCTGDFNTITGVSSVTIAKTGYSFILASDCILAANVNLSVPITVSSNASLIATDNWNSSTVTNNGTITVNGTTWSSGALTNTGIMNVNSVTNFTAGTVTSNGTINAPSGIFSISGNFSNSGTFNADGGTVSFTDANHTLAGSTTFNNLTMTGLSAARILTFTAGTTQTILGTLNLTGASGKVLSLRSSSATNAWSIDPRGTRTISYVDVQDSTNTNIATIYAGTGSVDSLRNTNWVFTTQPPTAPTLLGPTGVVGGGFITINQPTFTFSLSDPDGVDTVKYEIQIDDTADFSSPIVDYTSALDSNPTSASFTVGQAVGGGIYSVGAQNQTLSDSSEGYYWRVRAIDNNNESSSFTIANSGAVAFRILVLTYTQSDYQFYENTDALQPSTTLGGQSTATTIFSTSSPVRLIMNLLVGANDLLASFQQFKLQVSTNTSTGWLDVLPRADWWNNSWQNRRKITFNNSASTENLTDFPVLVSLTSSNIDYAKTQNSGQDIRFVDADGTPLNYEIEKWDASGTSFVWVKVPQIDANSSTDYIWMYYNNSDAFDDSNVAGVWDGDYKTVQHLPNGATLTANDSTSNSVSSSTLNGTSPTIGEIDGAASFNGTSNNIDFGTPSSLLNMSQGATTWSAWVKTSAGGSVMGRDDNNISSGWSLGVTAALKIGFLMVNSGSDTRFTSTGSIPNGSWSFITVVKDSSTSPYNIKAYINGQPDSSSAFNSTQDSDTAQHFYIGNSVYNNLLPQVLFNGQIDEVRISDIVRSSSYIQAEYLTDSNQFNVYAPEETAGNQYWQFYNNPSVASGTPISATLLSTSNVGEVYTESNPTATNPLAALANQRIEYDFALDISSILKNIAYYFRMVKDDGTALDTYTNYPTLTLTADTADPTPGTLSIDPTSPTSLTASISGASDGGSGLSTTPYIFYNTTASTDSGATADTSWLSESLTPNTSYSFYTKVSDLAGNDANTDPVFKYTLANVPTAPEVTTDSDTQLTIFWSANDNPAGTEYLVANKNSLTDSEWVTDTSYAWSGLTCGTAYSFNVKARNADNIDTDSTDSVSGTTAACAEEVAVVVPPSGGGGGMPFPPPPLLSQLPLPPLLPPSSSPVEPSPIIPTPLIPESPVVSPEPIESPVIVPLIPEPSASEPLVEIPSLLSIEDIFTNIFSVSNNTVGSAIAKAGSVLSTLFNVSKGTMKLTQNIFETTVKFGKTGQKRLASIPVDPEVSTGVSTLAVAPTILFLQYSLSTQAAIFNGFGSLADMWYMILGLLQGLLTSLGLRTRRRYWGTVYDSKTKQPIDPAIVELIDATSGKVLETSITDLAGRFGFLDQKGSYRIRVKKTHYVFPSEIITGTTDSIFENVYHGEVIEISNLDALLTPNIPMDSVAFDWNQEAKQKILKFHPNLEMAIRTSLSILFWLGFAFSIFNLVAHFNPMSGLFIFIYVGLIALRKFIPDQKLWGRIEGGGIDTSGLLLELSPKQIPQTIVARAMANKTGKFFLKASKGEYVLRIKKINGSELVTILESEVSIGQNGVVNKTITL